MSNCEQITLCRVSLSALLLYTEIMLFRVESPFQSISGQTSSQHLASIRLPEKGRGQRPSTNTENGDGEEEEQAEDNNYSSQSDFLSSITTSVKCNTTR